MHPLVVPTAMPLDRAWTCDQNAMRLQQKTVCK
jgi:hypothetical protein